MDLTQPSTLSMQDQRVDLGSCGASTVNFRF
jgi:hypothetical protein